MSGSKVWESSGHSALGVFVIHPGLVYHIPGRPSYSDPGKRAGAYLWSGDPVVAGFQGDLNSDIEDIYSTIQYRSLKAFRSMPSSIHSDQILIDRDHGHHLVNPVADYQDLPG